MILEKFKTAVSLEKVSKVTPVDGNEIRFHMVEKITAHAEIAAHPTGVQSNLDK